MHVRIIIAMAMAVALSNLCPGCSQEPAKNGNASTNENQPATSKYTAKRLKDFPLQKGVTLAQIIAVVGSPTEIFGSGIEYDVYKLDDGRYLVMVFGCLNSQMPDILVHATVCDRREDFLHGQTIFFDERFANHGTASSQPATQAATQLIDNVKNHKCGGKELEGREDVLVELRKMIKTLNVDDRKNTLREASCISGMKAHQRWIFSSAIAAFYVESAACDDDTEVRLLACDLLVEHVPSKYVSIHSAAIIKAAADGKIENALLLGMTGAVEARSLLRKDGKLWKANESKAKAALAKLGDAALSKEFVDAYIKETDPVKKAALAALLGYIGDASCVLTLARDIRTSEVYITGACQRSLRVDIIAAISAVYPEESVFWHWELATTSGDIRDWYAAVEKWLEEHLGMSWQNSRPEPFAELIIPTFN